MDSLYTKTSEQRFDDFPTLRKVASELAFLIRHGKLAEVGRVTYALPLLMGAMEAICCGHNRLTAVEMGVAKGRGLLELCAAAAFYRNTLGVDIQVIGFDNATGLPPANGYRDHPELWDHGEFLMSDPNVLRSQLPDFAKLIIGDIADTVTSVRDELLAHPLGFLAIDVDYYTSTLSCLKLLDLQAECYLPAVPAYFDDLEVFITNSDWSGEPLAIAEFNATRTERKLQRNRESRINRFYTAHVLDHPIREGTERPRFPLRVPIF